VTALDFAFTRLLYLRAVAGCSRRRLHPAQADVTALPLRDASFDLIVCTQVLEHVPSPAGRRALVTRFHRLLAPAGHLLLTVYNYSEPWRRHGAPREGRHATGIFYHCYDAEELARELAAFRAVAVRGILNELPHTYRLWPRLGPLGRACDHAASRARRLSCRWGHLLLADARR
ncbi:MAG: class I SAM-dependent methyltransferase, partial [Terracidiphilus sp.]